MKIVIDEFNSLDNWTVSDASVEVNSLNDYDEYIAGNTNTKSLIVNFKTGSEDEYFEKVFPSPIDVSLINEIVFSLWSREKKNQGNKYRKTSDFVYSIDFGAGKEYLVPTFGHFTDINIDITDLTSIERIRISCLHNDGDYLILSHMVGVTDEMPLDIFQAVKEKVEYNLGLSYPDLLTGNKTLERNGVLNKGIKIGEITASINDKSINLETPNYIDKGSVILIDDGINSETHQIDKDNNSEISFTGYYDKSKILNNFTNANVYMVIPFEIGTQQSEAVIPSITAWGMTPEPEFDENKESIILDTMKPDGSVRSRRHGQQFSHTIIVDCIARQNNIIAFQSEIVRAIMGRELLYINGHRCEITFEGSPTTQEPVDEHNQIYKVQWTMKVVIKEELSKRHTRVSSSSATLTTTLKQQGSTL